MFAKKALDEIEQWRQSRVSPQHQLDWRWVERYRTLASYDTYWWLASAGTFTQEEQRQWEQAFSRDMDEATKKHLGTLMARSTQREVQAAIAEQREPRFRYPALDIAEVRRRMADLSQLLDGISQSEPNAIVRRLYQGAIEEEINTLCQIEATHEGNNESFKEYMLTVIPAPTPEEMHHALLRVQDDVLQGLLRAETRTASERVIRLLREQCGLSLDLAHTQGEAQAVPESAPPAPTSPQHMVSAEAAKRFFESALQEAGFHSWDVVIDPNASSARVEQGLRCLFLADCSLSVKQIKHLLSHELAGHVARCVAGERSLLGLLGIHTKGSLETEEGLAIYYDIQEEKQQGKGDGEGRLWPGTLATGFASGVLTPPQTFLSLFNFFEALFLLRRLLGGLDPNEETARKKARQAAISRCLRTYRGVPDLEQAGICFTKDALYLRGWWAIVRALKQDEHVLERLAVGVVGIEQLPDLLELGIVHTPQPLRQLAEDSQLDTYILLFEEPEKQAFSSHSMEQKTS